MEPNLNDHAVQLLQAVRTYISTHSLYMYVQPRLSINIYVYDKARVLMYSVQLLSQGSGSVGRSSGNK